MKNLKKILLSMMVLLLAFAFIGCPAEPDPEPPVTPKPETPVVTNNFKGNVFVAEYSVGPYSGIWGYIEFIDDTNGKMGIPDYDEAEDSIIPIIREQPFTYSVTDDKATLKATMEGGEFTVTTEKLTDGRFTFSIEDVDEEGNKIPVLMTCTKGDKSLFDIWTVVDGEETLDKDFFYEFEDYVEVLVEKDDYNLDTANKKIVLTANGHKKCCGDWTLVAGEDVSEYERYIENMLIFNMIGLKETTDYTIKIETSTITVTESGMEKIQDAMWTISYPAGGFEETSLEFMLFEFYEDYGLVDGDYTKDDATKTITLTESGWEKVRWTVQYPEGTVVKTFASDVACNFVSSIGLYQGTDYTVDYKARTITLLTEDSLNKVNAAYTVLDPDGKYLMAFPTLTAAGNFADEYGLNISNDCTIDDEAQTITLNADGWEKLQPWTVLDSEGNVVETFACLKEAEDFASTIPLVEGDDYSKDDAENTITLTAAGLAKVQEAMGGV